MEVTTFTILKADVEAQMSLIQTTFDRLEARAANPNNCPTPTDRRRQLRRSGRDVATRPDYCCFNTSGK